MSFVRDTFLSYFSLGLVKLIFWLDYERFSFFLSMFWSPFEMVQKGRVIKVIIDKFLVPYLTYITIEYLRKHSLCACIMLIQMSKHFRFFMQSTYSWLPGHCLIQLARLLVCLKLNDFLFLAILPFLLLLQSKIGGLVVSLLNWFIMSLQLLENSLRFIRRFLSNALLSFILVLLESAPLGQWECMIKTTSMRNLWHFLTFLVWNFRMR